METTLNIQGMTCQHCQQAVEGAVSQLNGVDSAVVDLTANHVTVSHDDHVTVNQMKEAIEDQGYDVI